jgi:hypothetical protein
MICYAFLFLVSCLLRVELHEVHLVGNLQAYSFSVYLATPCGCHPWVSQSRRWDPMGSEVLCSWFLLGLLLQRQIPRRSQPIISFSILYLILFQLPLMSAFHLVVVLVIG